MTETSRVTFLLEHHAHISSENDLLHGATIRQKILERLCTQIVKDLTPKCPSISYFSNGVKSAQRLHEKCTTRLGGKPKLLGDTCRVIFLVSHPDHAKNICELLGKRQSVCDEGWKIHTRGIMTRQIFIALPGEDDKKYVAEILVKIVPPHQFPDLHKLDLEIYNTTRILTGENHAFSHSTHSPELVNLVYEKYCNIAATLKGYGDLPITVNPNNIDINADDALWIMFSDLISQCRAIHNHAVQYADPSWKQLFTSLQKENPEQRQQY